MSAAPRARIVRFDRRDKRVEQVAPAVDIADRIDPLTGRNCRKRPVRFRTEEFAQDIDHGGFSSGAIVLVALCDKQCGVRLAVALTQHMAIYSSPDSFFLLCNAAKRGS